MELSATQLAQYERDGFLIFPDLFAPPEIAVPRQEVARLVVSRNWHPLPVEDDQGVTKAA